MENTEQDFNTAPSYTDCRNCGTCDHTDYACPCACHDDDVDDEPIECCDVSGVFQA